MPEYMYLSLMYKDQISLKQKKRALSLKLMVKRSNPSYNTIISLIHHGARKFLIMTLEKFPLLELYY